MRIEWRRSDDAADVLVLEVERIVRVQTRWVSDDDVEIFMRASLRQRWVDEITPVNAAMAGRCGIRSRGRAEGAERCGAEAAGLALPCNGMRIEQIDVAEVEAVREAENLIAIRIQDNRVLSRGIDGRRVIV